MTFSQSNFTLTPKYVFYNVDHLYIVINFTLYTKTYIFVIHFSTYYDYAYYIYSALFLLKIFIDDFNNKKIN